MSGHKEKSCALCLAKYYMEDCDVPEEPHFRVFYIERDATCNSQDVCFECLGFVVGDILEGGGAVIQIIDLPRF